MSDVKFDPSTTKTVMVKWHRSARWARKHLGRRFCDVVFPHHPWWDWGHRLMALVGKDVGGNWSSPVPQTWWYRKLEPKRMWRTGYPIHPRSTYLVVKSYHELRSRTAGLNEDEMYPWQAINVNQDGDLHLGHRYWGGAFYSLDKNDVWLLRKYLRYWRRVDWWGARSWLFSQALNAAVYQRKPFACQEAPPKGSGGYDHWLCRERRGHDGPHRVQNYTWDRAARSEVEQ